MADHTFRRFEGTVCKQQVFNVPVSYVFPSQGVVMVSRTRVLDFKMYITPQTLMW